MNNFTTLLRRYTKSVSKNIEAVTRNFRFTNEQSWRQAEIVEEYSKSVELQKPEQTILGMFKERLPLMTMLDIGVGGGRTTRHFAPLTKEYTGIDYSPEMVASCKKLFSENKWKISFEVCDARNMSMFPNETFDFMLFSFNGIDSVSHEDRYKILKEVQRIGKSGGYFCFSSHNLDCKSLIQRFTFNPGLFLHPLAMYNWFLRMIYNDRRITRRLNSLPFVILNDGGQYFRLRTYYIRPKEQIEQLSQYFTDIHVFSLITGQEITNEEKSGTAEDSDWLYYLCTIK